MFKRGGTPAQGSGIMSHVEAKPNFAIGGGVIQGNNMGSRTGFENPRFVNLGGGQPVTRTRAPMLPPNAPFTYGPQVNPNISFGRGLAGLGLMGSTFAPVAGLAYLNRPKTVEELKYMQEMGPIDETMTEDQLSDYFKTRKEKAETGTPISIEQLPDSVLSAMGTEEARGILNKRKDTGKNTVPTPTEDGGLDVYSNEDMPQPDVPDKKAPPTEKDIMSAARSEIENEAKLIKDLLRDGDYSKGEMALLVAESLATPGGFNKKLETARKLGGEIAKTQRKEDKAITLEAYKRFKEKERETIKAGKLGDTESFINRRIELGLKNSNKTKSPSGETLYDGLTENQYKEKIISSRLGEDKFNEALSKARLHSESQSIGKDITKINELQAKQKISPLNKEELDILAARTRKIKAYSKLPGFKDVFGISLDDPAYIGGFASGGRVNYAEGGIDSGEDTVDEIITSEVPSDTTETPVKPVMKLSYEELRTRLPQEITDDIVRLLSNSEQALQDFAYLQTQQDVGGFNVKYGVNLVLPPQA